MARTFKEIENSIIEGLTTRNITLNKSKVAEWRVWTATVAGVIYTFETILDVFRGEIESHTNIVRTGTADWYAVMMRKYQYGHTLHCDKDTYEVGYEVDDEESLIIKQVAVKELDNYLLIKLATHDTNGKVVPLSLEQSKGIKAYLEAIKFVGTKVRIISQEADTIKYSITAYCRDDADPLKVADSIKKSLDAYKSNLAFDAKLYSNKLINVVMMTDDVVTASLDTLERKSYERLQYATVGIVDTMEAGYYEYDPASSLIVKRINELTDED